MTILALALALGLAACGGDTEAETAATDDTTAVAADETVGAEDTYAEPTAADDAFGATEEDTGAIEDDGVDEME